jgi:fused signal recognition particle receptor
MDVIRVFSKVDEALFEELEEVLIMSDVGVETSSEIIERLRQKAREEKIQDGEALRLALKEIIADIMGTDEEFSLSSPAVVLVIGVNGVGKTTSIGKLAAHYKSQGKKVIVAAADTFRAAAIDQLQIWADRVGVDIIKQQEGSDPASVVFDAINAARAREADVLICDTAGRLHNKKNLMDELAKINKIIDREMPNAQKEVFLVLDATTGQNALSQAKSFSQAADITGIILTKLDGTAKGGIVIAIKREQDIPVRFIGVGEQVDDLQPFSAQDYVEALF